MINSPSELMSIDTVEQKTWVDLCIAGDRNSQRKLYEMHYGKMLAVCLRYARDMDEAKDMLQDGFIKVFNSLDKYSHNGSLEGWIRRIMVNTAIDRIRKDKRSLILNRSEELLDEGAELPEEYPEEDFDIPMPSCMQMEGMSLQNDNQISTNQRDVEVEEEEEN